ncbi:MAG: cytochrome P450 [Woeseiaceae bacterium]
MSQHSPIGLPHPFQEDYVQDPYPFLAVARRDAPVTRIDELNLWVVTRYEDIKNILLDPETFSNTNAQQPLYPLCERAQKVLSEGGFAPTPSLSSSDDPAHARMRKNISKVVSFTPSRTAKLKPWIQTQATTLIDAFADRGHADLVTELTHPLPAHVMFHLIGFPEEDSETLLSWCVARLQLTWGRLSPGEQTVVAEHMVKYWKYCERFIATRADDLKDDYASELLRIHLENPDALSTPEIATAIYGLTFAGQETASQFMASMLRLLLEKRERWEELLHDRGMISNTVEECLRLEPSIAAWRRITTRDTEIAGVSIPKGSHLLLHLGAGGHDSEMFSNGEEYEARRPNANAHLAFGYGVHYCLGAGLARAEAQLVLELLLGRFPQLRLVPGQDFGYVSNLCFRGPEHLFVEWP